MNMMKRLFDLKQHYLKNTYRLSFGGCYQDTRLKTIFAKSGPDIFPGVSPNNVLGNNFQAVSWGLYHLLINGHNLLD